MRRLIQDGHCGATLAARLPRVVVPDPRNITASPGEYAALVSTPCEPWLRLLWLMCASIGLRSGTARKLPLAAFDLTNGTVTVRTKFGRAMTLPVPAELAAAVVHNPRLPVAASAVAHAIGLTGAVPDTKRVWRAWGRWKARAGVRPELRLHDFRRTLAVMVYDRTHDLRAVQALLGHRRLSTSLLYLDHNTTPVPAALLQQFASERVQ